MVVAAPTPQTRLIALIVTASGNRPLGGSMGDEVVRRVRSVVVVVVQVLLLGQG